MHKNRSRLLATTALLGLSLLLGCGANAGAGGGASASPAPSGQAAEPAPPGKVEVIEVKEGDGPSVDDAGGIATNIKIWSDKFDGQPFGRGEMSMTLIPDVTELPGLLNAMKGMKKGGVKRLSLQARDLFADIPAGAPISPEQMFYLEATVTDVFPKEPFDIKTVKAGSGEKAAAKGDPVKVHYVGKLEGFDSKNVFDSSRERNQPFTLVLGQGQVIPGWEMGLEGMKKGELRRLSIPHYLAYGDKAQGDKIPAKSRLFFEVELLDFITPGELKQTVKKQGSGEAIHAGELGNFHYTGWSDGFNGKAKFDSSRDRGTPIPVKLGAGQVIQGWDLGLLGMKPGEVRLLEIPYNLAYGERGKPPSIPGYATLYFEVEYVGPATPPTPAPAPQAPPTP